jgi:hypothetical protein
MISLSEVENACMRENWTKEKTGSEMEEGEKRKG